MARNINFFDGAQSSTVPTIGNIVASDLVTYANDAAYEAGESGSPVEGNLYFNTTSNVIRYYNGTAWIDQVDASTAQTVTNKSIDGSTNTITNVDGDNVIVDTISSLTATDAQAAFAEHQGDITTLETDKEDKSSKGVSNGYASLDAGAKVPVSELPDAVLGGPTFQGTWNASTNTPTLADGTGTQGDYYRVSVAGTTTIDGENDWGLADWIIFNGTAWDKIDNSESVTSVASKTGAVTLVAADVSDFDTEVGNNSAVTANTAKVSADGSIGTHSDVDVTTSTPTNGQVLTYVTGSSKWENQTAVGGGGTNASMHKNYFNEFGAFDSAGDVTDDVDLYDDTGAYVDGTGGSPATLSKAHTTSGTEILEGAGSIKITKAATDGSGEGFSFTNLTIDRKDQSKILKGSLSIDLTDANYTAGDLAIHVYDVTNSVVLTSYSPDESGLPALKTKVNFYVKTGATTVEIRVSVHLASDSQTASTWDGFFDSLKLTDDFNKAEVCDVQYSTNANAAINGSISIVDFEDIGHDPFSLVTTGASWKYVPGETGVYMVEIQGTTDSEAWTVNNSLTSYLYVNNIHVSVISSWNVTNTTSYRGQFEGMAVFRVTDATHNVDVRAASDVTTNTFSALKMTITKLG